MKGNFIMKLNKQTIIRAIFAHTVICSLLAAIFAGKKKTISSIFAGLSIAGAIANVALVFSDKCPICRKKLKLVDDMEEFDDESFDDSDIYCDFEDDLTDDEEEVEVTVEELTDEE